MRGGQVKGGASGETGNGPCSFVHSGTSLGDILLGSRIHGSGTQI